MNDFSTREMIFVLYIICVPKTIIYKTTLPMNLDVKREGVIYRKNKRKKLPTSFSVSHKNKYYF